VPKTVMRLALNEFDSLVLEKYSSECNVADPTVEKLKYTYPTSLEPEVLLSQFLSLTLNLISEFSKLFIFGSLSKGPTMFVHVFDWLPDDAAGYILFPSPKLEHDDLSSVHCATLETHSFGSSTSNTADPLVVGFVFLLNSI
jgi:hypothetical protein